MLYKHYPDDLIELIDYEDEAIEKVCFKVNSFLERFGIIFENIVGWL